MNFVYKADNLPIILFSMIETFINAFEIVKLDNVIITRDDNKINYINNEITYVIDIKNNCKVSTDNKYLGDHINRIKQINIATEEDILDSIQKLNDILLNPYEYCTVSGEKIEIYIDKISYNDKYFDEFCNIVTDNTLKDSFNDDKTAFNFIISTGIHCLCLEESRRKIFMNPEPKLIKDFIEFKKNIYVEKINDITSVILKADNDYDIYKELDNEKYYFLKYLIKTNKTVLKCSKNNLDNSKIVDELPLNILDIKDHLVVNVINPPIIEDEFNKEEPEFMFHGSGLANWYGILRNGLKNCSGTNMQVHGQVYGKGIYLSPYSSTALGYASGGLNGCAIVQIRGKKESYMKTPYIYVVPNEADVILKYIIFSKNAITYNPKERSKQTFFGHIDEYYTRTRKAEILTSRELTNNIIITKRMNKETSELKKLGFDIELDINKFKFNKDGIIGIVEYPDLYPSAPPIIRLITGNVKSKFITKNGLFTVPDIYLKYWTGNTKISKIINKVFESLEIVNDKELLSQEEAYKEYMTVHHRNI